MQDINRSNKNRLSDQFYVSYMKIPENTGNLLGKQTKRIERPNLRFEVSNIAHRRNQVTSPMQLRFEPIELALFDDEQGLTIQAVYTQIFRQLNEGKDLYGNWGNHDERDYKFDIQMEMKDSRGNCTEGYILRDCFISGIRHTEMTTVEGETQTEISLTITFNNIDFWIVDKYVSAKA